MKEPVTFSWSNDVSLIQIRLEEVNKFINNVLVERDLLKKYHKLSEDMLDKYIWMFLRSVDKSLLDRFVSKLKNKELFINNNLAVGNYGLTFP